MADRAWKFAKDPEEILDYDLSWERQMTKDSDTIASSTWEVPSDLVEEDSSFTDTVAKVVLSGGTAGTTYTLTNTITTTGQRTHQRDVDLKVANR